MLTYAYMHVFISMSRVIVFLFLEGYCSKEQLDSTEKLHDYERNYLKTSPDTLWQLYKS